MTEAETRVRDIRVIPMSHFAAEARKAFDEKRLSCFSEVETKCVYRGCDGTVCGVGAAFDDATFAEMAFAREIRDVMSLNDTRVAILVDTDFMTTKNGTPAEHLKDLIELQKLHDDIQWSRPDPEEEYDEAGLESLAAARARGIDLLDRHIAKMVERYPVD